MVCPLGCLCQAVRAPGAKWTLLAFRREAPNGAATVSIYTAPVNHSLGPLLVPMLFLVTFMVSPSMFVLVKGSMPRPGAEREASDPRFSIGSRLSLRLQRWTRRGDDVIACVGVAIDAPATLGRFGDQYPGAIREAWVAGRGNDDLRQLFDNAELLFAIEHVDRSEHLDADVVAFAGRVRDRIGGQVMDERCGVVQEQRNLGHLLPAHDGLREILRQRVLVLEGVFGGIDVNHWHGYPSSGL